MKRQTRKSVKKLPMLWDEAMDFEVAIKPAVEQEESLDTKIIVLPLLNPVRYYPHTPTPPLAA